MYRNIIVGLSLEHGISERALRAASALADEDAKITAVHVQEPLHTSVRFFISQEDLRKAKEQTEEALKQRVGDATRVTPVVLEGNAGQTLSDYARDVGADCIVVGSHKPGLRDYLPGSTATKIVAHAPCSVHVLR